MNRNTMDCDAPVGPAEEGARCARPAIERLACGHCGVVAGLCSEAHREGAKRSLAAHTLLVHPEEVPHVICRLAKDPVRSATIFAGEARQPAVFGKLAAMLRLHILPPRTPARA